MTRLILFLSVTLFLVACAGTLGSTARENSVPFDQALNQTIDDLFAQAKKLPGFVGNLDLSLKPRTIVVDPLLDGTSGQQTEVTRLAEQRMVQRVRSQFHQFSVARFSEGAAAAKAQYLLNGTLTPAAGSLNEYRLKLALTEIRSGIVVAQAASRVTDPTLDTTPTAFYRDSPVMARERVLEGYIRTADTQVGQSADWFYIESLPTSAVLAQANEDYESGRLSEALRLYETATTRADGQHLRALNGLYLTQWQLGHPADAETTFGEIAKLGLATNNLNVKFLFKPGTTEFVSNPKLSAPYSMWLRQIARLPALQELCVNIVGHTSRTGTEQYNEWLSLQRAMLIKSRLRSEAPHIASRLREEGMGFRENIAGTGTDDKRDALDRRVEFKIVDCDEVRQRAKKL